MGLLDSLGLSSETWVGRPLYPSDCPWQPLLSKPSPETIVMSNWASDNKRKFIEKRWVNKKRVHEFPGHSSCFPKSGLCWQYTSSLFSLQSGILMTFYKVWEFPSVLISRFPRPRHRSSADRGLKITKNSFPRIIGCSYVLGSLALEKQAQSQVLLAQESGVKGDALEAERWGSLFTSCVTPDELVSLSLRLLICKTMKAGSFYLYFPPCQLRALASKEKAPAGS